VQYNNAPKHVQLGYPLDCAKCHTETNWLNSSFNHTTTSFPLTGKHTTTLCSACHTTTFEGTPTTCNSCHATNYTQAALPGHVAAGIPNDCATCHTAAGWKPSTFNHLTTGFELKGGHKTVAQCSSCHKGNITTAKPECVSCHQAQYNNAPKHVQLSYPSDCAKCHTETNWLNSSFNHATTSFPLTGKHTTTLCSACHTTTFAGTPTACNSCHATSYTQAALPGHVAAGIPNDCATCHTAAGWKPSTFDHLSTGFELKGGHKTVAQCSSCHKGNITSAKPECVSCHQAQYNNAPKHVQLSYPSDCARCHTETNWLNSSFNHATTSFPLTGKHTTTLCSACHTTTFAGTPTACFSCHVTNYNSASNPNHLSAKFPHNCESCHTTIAWTPSTFNHDGQYFPINSGKHKGEWVLCSECHTTSNFASYSCIVCHEHSSKNSVDGDHKDVKNYVYSGISCYTCHITGRK
jgi:uncharacterized paraquat-inducible protein A